MEIELLSPAKNADIGIEAIRHGADAVYIGAPKFGARAAAGNSVADLARLTEFAHLYYAKVYVALNTILTDTQLQEAEALIRELYAIGIDALIVQDMGIFALDLPPIPLHASTQMDNRTPEKVRFLQDIGCAQVVLARECSIADICAIRQATTVPLEAFVHGALCVSYSGNCYASCALCGRSANRGACAQICRLPFDLQDAAGHSLGKKHWLSLQDLNLSAHLEEMIEAGISSFKIEGRLKDMGYVKNVTAYYRQALDAVLAKHPDWRRSSEGESRLTFRPQLNKSFSRGGSTYFYAGQRQWIAAMDTPKSTGEPIGDVLAVEGKCVQLRSTQALHNGDGFCFQEPGGTWLGFRANRVEGNTLHLSEWIPLRAGTPLYRNYDADFQRQLERPSAERKIPLHLQLSDTEIALSDGQHTVHFVLPTGWEPAKKTQRDTILRQWEKLGDTPYELRSSAGDCCWFIPASQWAAWRRQLVGALTELRMQQRPRGELPVQKTSPTFPQATLDFRANVCNHKAEAFYQRHGVQVIQPAYEWQAPQGVPVMECKYCLRQHLGACDRHPLPNQPLRTLAEPLHLIYKNYYLRLAFDCQHCRMWVYKE